MIAKFLQTTDRRRLDNQTDRHAPIFKLSPNRRICQTFCTLVVLTTLSSVNLAVSFAQSKSEFQLRRFKMVDEAVIAAGVTDQRVIAAMRAVPRHEFVPKGIREQAYLDAGLPIGAEQTISSPFIVAYMTQEIDPQPTDKVLEIGTGSGYQAAILSGLVAEVYSIEIVESLGKTAAKTLKKLDYKNVVTKIGDGYQGWSEHAPFDKIIVTCSPEKIPQPLVDQLREGGLIVVPIGQRHQQSLVLSRKTNGEMKIDSLRPTLFVPMTGVAEAKREVLPDPTNPKILNAGFEEGLDERGFVKGWYYQRKLKLRVDENAPEGTHLVEFINDIPGQNAHLMQGFAIDGRHVSRLLLTASVACQNIVPGPNPTDVPLVSVAFYDDERSELNTSYLGPLTGTSAWKHKSLEIRVPVAAREAIVRIGLFGATGSASFDRVNVRAVE